MESNNSLELALESELGWLRALALQLVADASAADDLVQEALLTALRARPTLTDSGSARRWFRSVLNLRARQAWRSQRRRREHEERAARPEAIQDAHETAALAEAQRALSEAVHALAEPYRSVVLLRYFEGLTPAQIAARRGVPAATVRSQLLRAHEQLRAALDRRHGGDARAWSAAFVPLVLDRSALTQAAWLGLPLALLIAMLKPWIALALTLVCGVGLWRWSSNDSTAAPTTAATTTSAAHANTVDPRSDAREGVDLERRELALEPTADRAPRRALLRGRVIDAATRQPLAGLELHVIQGTDELIATDAEGRFECTRALAAGRIWIRGVAHENLDSSQLNYGQWGGDAVDSAQDLNWNGRDEVEVELPTALFVPLLLNAPVQLLAGDLIAQAHLRDPSEGEVCVQTPVRGAPPHARFPQLNESFLTGAPRLLRLVSRDGLWRGEALTPMPRPASEGPLRIELLASGNVTVELAPSPTPEDTAVMLRRQPKGPAFTRGENERRLCEGRTEFGGLDAGEYELDVRAAGFERVVRRVAVTPGQVSMERVVLTPLVASASVRGELRTRSGQASEWTTLSLMSSDFGVWREIIPEWVERDGRWLAPFEFAGVPVGAYQLRITNAGSTRAWSGASPEVAAPAQGLVLTCDDLAPTTRLELQIVDAGTGEPITEGFVAGEAGLAYAFAKRQPAMHLWVFEYAEGLEVRWQAGCEGYATARGTNRTATLVDGVWRQRVELQRAAK